MISDSEGPVERLNLRSTLGCNSNVFLEEELTVLLELGVLSFPRCRVKSNSRSIEDSSSFSFADDIVVQAVAVLPLLSDELDDLPRPSDSEEPTCWPSDPSTRFHLRLTPLSA